MPKLHSVRPLKKALRSLLRLETFRPPCLVGYSSGQRGQTVNLLGSALRWFESSSHHQVRCAEVTSDKDQVSRLTNSSAELDENLVRRSERSERRWGARSASAQHRPLGRQSA